MSWISKHTFITENRTVSNLTWLLFKYNVFMIGTYFCIDIAKWLHKVYVDRKNSNEINEVLFTKEIDCQHCNICKYPRLIGCNDCDQKYCFYYTLSKMKSVIDGAQHTLYICMNVFTSNNLSELVLNAHLRGVSVKIIANYSTAYATGSQLIMLQQNGIAIRYQTSQSCVHHKFCLIDPVDPEVPRKQNQSSLPVGARKIPKNGVLISGSMNWTYQAMDKNWENIMITSDKFLVDEFHKEFFAIWNRDDIVEFR